MGQNEEFLGEMWQFYEHPELKYSGIKSPKDAEIELCLNLPEKAWNPGA